MQKQRLFLKSQRGSILAGVLVLSLVMTIAAGGLLLASSAARSAWDESIKARKLLHAGEMVMQMSVRHMRDKKPFGSFGNIPTSNDSIAITPNWPNYTYFQNTYYIRSAYRKAASDFKVYAWATFGGTSDTVQLTWRITGFTCCRNNANHSDLINYLNMEDWNATYLRYRP